MKNKKMRIIVIGIVATFIAAVFILFFVTPLFTADKLQSAFDKGKISYEIMSYENCKKLGESFAKEYPGLGKVSVKSFGEIMREADDDSEGFGGGYYQFYDEDVCKAVFAKITEDMEYGTVVVRKGKVIIAIESDKIPAALQTTVNALSGSYEEKIGK